jgi:integrase
MSRSIYVPRSGVNCSNRRHGIVVQAGVGVGAGRLDGIFVPVMPYCKIWSIEDEEAFLKSATTHLRLPLLLALWTGQPRGDLLRLLWSAYDGKELRPRRQRVYARGSRRLGLPPPRRRCQRQHAVPTHGRACDQK